MFKFLTVSSQAQNCWVLILWKWTENENAEILHCLKLYILSFLCSSTRYCPVQHHTVVSSKTDQLIYSWLMTTNVLLHAFSAHRFLLGICLRIELMVTGFSRFCQKVSKTVIPTYILSRSVKVFHRFTAFPPLDNVRFLILSISLVEIFLSECMFPLLLMILISFLFFLSLSLMYSLLKMAVNFFTLH